MSNLWSRITKLWKRPATEPVAAPDMGYRPVEASEVSIDTIKPSQFRAILTAAEGGDISGQAELFDRMQDRDGLLASHLRTRRMGVRACGWEIVPDEDAGARGEKVAQFCRDVLAGVDSMDEAIDGLLGAVGHGFSMCEILWDLSEKQWGLKGLEFRPQRWFTLDPYEGQTLRLRDGSAYGAEINPLNFCEFRHQAVSGFLPTVPLLRTCVRYFIVRQYGWREWTRFVELFGTPLRVGWLQQGVAWDSSEATALKAAVKAIGHDFAAVMRDGNRLEFPSAGGVSAHSDIYERLLGVTDKEMTLAILGQLLTSGGEGGGSYALGKVHERVRFDLVDADAAALEKAMRRRLLGPIAVLNFGPDAPVPHIRFARSEPKDLNLLSTVVASLAEAGLPIEQDWCYETFGIRPPEEGKPILVKAPMPGVAANTMGAPGSAAGGLSAHQTVIENQLTTGSFALPPRRAIAWLREKIAVSPQAAATLSPAMKQKAFWVSGIESQVKGMEVQAVLEEMLVEGQTPAEFRRRLRERGLLVEPGQDLGRDQIGLAHADVVYRAQEAGARSAEHWMQMMQSRQSRPWWKYRTVGDDNVRAAHRALDGVVRRWDDEFWRDFYPPWEFMCRCQVTNLSADEAGQPTSEAQLAARWDAAQHTTFPQDFDRAWKEVAHLYEERAGRGERLQGPPANPGWSFDRGDAFFLASEGESPAGPQARDEWRELLRTGLNGCPIRIAQGRELDAITEYARGRHPGAGPGLPMSAERLALLTLRLSRRLVLSGRAQAVKTIAYVPIRPGGVHAEAMHDTGTVVLYGQDTGPLEQDGRSAAAQAQQTADSVSALPLEEARSQAHRVAPARLRMGPVGEDDVRFELALHEAGHLLLAGGVSDTGALGGYEDMLPGFGIGNAKAAAEAKAEDMRVLLGGAMLSRQTPEWDATNWSGAKQRMELLTRAYGLSPNVGGRDRN